MYHAIIEVWQKVFVNISNLPVFGNVNFRTGASVKFVISTDLLEFFKHFVEELYDLVKCK